MRGWSKFIERVEGDLITRTTCGRKNGVYECVCGELETWEVRKDKVFLRGLSPCLAKPRAVRLSNHIVIGGA